MPGIGTPVRLGEGTSSWSYAKDSISRHTDRQTGLNVRLARRIIRQILTSTTPIIRIKDCANYLSADIIIPKQTSEFAKNLKLL